MAGHLRETVEELDSLQGLARNVSEDWLKLAKARLMADLVVVTALAEAEKSNAQIA